VFADLARKARSLKGETMLGGWLHRHTFVSSTLPGGGPGPNSVRAHAGTTVTVPAEPPSGTLDLGEIVLQALH